MKPRLMLTVICKNCFNAFEARKGNAKFCSPACRQHDYRVRHGQKTDNRFTKELQMYQARHMCLNCSKTFAYAGKGRKPKFCSNSCRQIAHLGKRHAAFKFVKMMNGRALGWTDLDCFTHVEQEGTDSIEKWANSLEWQYSYITKRFWKPSEEMRFDYVS